MNKYQNECRTCGHMWDSEFSYDSCPKCGELINKNIKTERIDEETD